MDVEIHILRVADAFKEEAQVAPALEGEEGFVYASVWAISLSEGGEETSR